MDNIANLDKQYRHMNDVKARSIRPALGIFLRGNQYFAYGQQSGLLDSITRNLRSVGGLRTNRLGQNRRHGLDTMHCREELAEG